MAFERRIETRYDANTAGFDRGTRRIETQLARLNRSAETRLGALDRRIERTGRVFAGVIGGLISVAALRSLSNGVKEVVARFDEIAKTADSIGITTDALQELRVAADLSGVSSDQLDTALKRLARTASDARNGLSTAERAFATVGVSVTDSNGNLKSLDVLLAEVANGFKGLGNETQRAATAQELFGRAGTSLVNLLNAGADGIAEMREQARQLGIVIDEDLLRKSEELNDQLALLDKVISANLSQALISLGPIVVDVARYFAEFAKAVGAAVAAVDAFIAGQSSRAITSRIAEIDQQIAALNATINDAAENPFDSRVFRLGQVADQQNKELEDANRELVILTGERERLVARLNNAGAGAAPPVLTPVTTPGSQPPPSGGKKSKEKVDTEGERILENLRARAQALREEQQLIGLTADAAARLAAQFEREAAVRDILAAAKKEGSTLTQQEIDDAIAAAFAVERLTNSNDALTESYRRQEEEARNAAQREEEFARAIEGAVNVTDDWRVSLQRLLEVLVKFGSQDFFGSLFTGGRGQANGGGVFSGIFDSIFSGIFGSSSAPKFSPLPVARPTFHSGGVVGGSARMRHVPDSVFHGAPRYHSGGIAGLQPGEVPAILQKGEIVVPKNVGMSRGASNVTVGDTVLNVTQPGASESELRAILAEHRKETIREIVQMNERNPNILHT